MKLLRKEVCYTVQLWFITSPGTHFKSRHWNSAGQRDTLQGARERVIELRAKYRVGRYRILKHTDMTEATT